MKRQMDGLEDGGFDKYEAYLENAELCLEVRHKTASGNPLWLVFGERGVCVCDFCRPNRY